MGGVELPDDETDSSRERERARTRITLNGVGSRRDCPSMPECQLAFSEEQKRRDEHLQEQLDRRFGEMQAQVAEVRTMLMTAISAGKIGRSDSTPAGRRGTMDLGAGPFKFRGSQWVILGAVIILGLTAGASFVLAEWGPPNMRNKPVTQMQK
jgi:hypothetical protein